MLKRTIAIGLVVGAMIAPVWGKGNAGAQHSQMGATKGKVPAIDVMALYAKDCAGCHGAKMEGRVGPSLQHEGKTRDLKWLVEKITDPASKMKGTSMPAASVFHLSAPEVKAIATYLSKQK